MAAQEAEASDGAAYSNDDFEEDASEGEESRSKSPGARHTNSKTEHHSSATRKSADRPSSPKGTAVEQAQRRDATSAADVPQQQQPNCFSSTNNNGSTSINHTKGYPPSAASKRPPRIGGGSATNSPSATVEKLGCGTGSSRQLLSPCRANERMLETAMTMDSSGTSGDPRSRSVSTGDAIEMAGGMVAGRRPVRAKLSVGTLQQQQGQRPDQADRSDSLPRPGTGDTPGSRHGAGVTPSSSAGLIGAGLGPSAQPSMGVLGGPRLNDSSKPIWLQGGALSSNDGRRGGGPDGVGAVNECSSSPPRGDHLNHRRSSSSEIHRQSSRNKLGSEVFAGMDFRTGTADGDDRKVKRLQQEIQRLTQRLKEAELVSSQDDGLPTFTLDNVELGYQIGAGGFSSVHYATWHCTPVSVKKIFDPVITEELRSEFENEVRMLRRLRHPNIITLMAVCRVPPALSILTEFMDGGSLYDLLHGPPQKRLPNAPKCEQSTLLPIMRQSAVGLAHMHSMYIAHRDVKSNNVLLSAGAQPTVKLCDFGLARLTSELCTGSMQWAGTAAYMAPELFAKKRYTEAVDMFAFGVMLWEASSLELPHANMDPADIAHRVQHKDAAGLPIAHGWPKPLKALIRSCISVNPDSRPPMASIVTEIQNVIHILPIPDT